MMDDIELNVNINIRTHKKHGNAHSAEVDIRELQKKTFYGERDEKGVNE